MQRSYFPLRVGDTEYRLRLTMAGQRALREQWGEEILPFLLSCASDSGRLCDLLTQCLVWPGQENPITDGAALYDLLVDAGWQGQARFAALAFDLGAASGLLTAQQAETLKETVARTVQTAFDGLTPT